LFAIGVEIILLMKIVHVIKIEMIFTIYSK
jgi:hypothetical protein